MRIVSLLAGATEIVCALDHGHELVGRSHECDNPAWVRSLPPCSEPAFDVSVSSGEIDREVRRRVRAREPLYHIDTNLIRELCPDLIFAQEHCEVCAVTPGDVERNGACIPGARIAALNAGSLEDVFESLVQVARELGIEAQGRALVETEKRRLEVVRARAAGQPRRSVVILEWANPVFPAGNWVPELVENANGELLLGNRDHHSSAMPADRLREADPDLLIVAPCGFELDRSCRELSVLESCSWWKGLQAVRTGRVAFADGNLFFNRAGMTVCRTAELIAEILHGTTFGTSGEGTQWRWLRDVEALVPDARRNRLSTHRVQAEFRE